MTAEEELKQLEVERKRLELEDLRNRVEKERAHRAQVRKSSEQCEAELNLAKVREAQLQSACPHRKGGKNLEGLWNGNSSDYSVVKHVLPWGEMIVLCTRCIKIWRPGDTDYAQALRFPTDNENTSASLFANCYPLDNGLATKLPVKQQFPRLQS